MALETVACAKAEDLVAALPACHEERGLPGYVEGILVVLQNPDRTDSLQQRIAAGGFGRLEFVESDFRPALPPDPGAESPGENLAAETDPENRSRGFMKRRCQTRRIAEVGIAGIVLGMLWATKHDQAIPAIRLPRQRFSFFRTHVDRPGAASIEGGGDGPEVAGRPEFDGKNGHHGMYLHH